MSIEFYYFKGFKGRGYPVKLALHAAGVPFEDKSMTFAELTEGKKEGKFLSGLPEMKTASGKTFTQSLAMARYAAKLGSSGLYPADPEVAMAVDCVMDICQDALTKCPQDPDEAVKKAKREEYAAGKLKAYMDSLSTMLQAGGGTFLGGDQLTIGDLVVKYFLMDMITSGMFDYVPPEYVQSWPVLVAHDKAVSEHAIIKAYEAAHP